MAYGEDIPYVPPMTGLYTPLDTTVLCEHDWLFLRERCRDYEKRDEFYCRRCLAKTEVRQ